jgi:hypothetical protein
MSEFLDAIIFIDRRQAKVFHVSRTDEVKLVFEHTSAQYQACRGRRVYASYSGIT